MKPSQQEIHGTLCAEEAFRRTLCCAPRSSDGLTGTVTVAVLLLAQAQSGVGGDLPKWQLWLDGTTTIVFPTHWLRLPKPLGSSCHCKVQFAFFSKSYALTYGKLPLFVSKIVFVSPTFSHPIPLFL